MKETIRTAKMALASLGPIAEGKRVGIGVASAFKNVGIGKGNVDNASAVLEMTARGKVRICVSTVDMGQGSRTAMTQLAAHELGIGMDRFEIITGDTALQNRATGIVGERGTYCAGNAVIGAARKFKEVLLEEVATTYEMPAENLRLRENGVTAGDVRISFEEIGQRLASLGRKVKEEYNYNAPKTFPISADGIPQSGTAVARSAQSGTAQNETEQYRNYPAYCCTTNVALVEVNELTGEVKVLKVIVAVDVGRAINPQKIEGQIEGSVLMGMGYALSEQFEVSDGIPEKDLKKCGIPTIDQTPGIVTLIIEDEDPEGPYGAKGMSEVACAPVTPAIINAIYDAVGVRIFDLPATRDKILNALKGGV
jgi:CO/xanthine dehydrogenase Mo-binding subunit